MAAISRFCTCGSSLTGRADKPQVLEAAWAEFHTGEGHAATDANGAAAARRREERALESAREPGERTRR